MTKNPYCKICGAPRKPGRTVPLCERHYHDYRRESNQRYYARCKRLDALYGKPAKSEPPLPPPATLWDTYVAWSKPVSEYDRPPARVLLGDQRVVGLAALSVHLALATLLDGRQLALAWETPVVLGSPERDPVDELPGW